MNTYSALEAKLLNKRTEMDARKAFIRSLVNSRWTFSPTSLMWSEKAPAYKNDKPLGFDTFFNASTLIIEEFYYHANYRGNGWGWSSNWWTAYREEDWIWEGNEKPSKNQDQNLNLDYPLTIGEEIELSYH